MTKVSDKLSLSSFLIRFRVIVNSCVDIADSVFSRGCKNGANTFSLTLPDSNRKCCSHYLSKDKPFSLKFIFLIHPDSQPQSDFSGLLSRFRHFRPTTLTFALHIHAPKMKNVLETPVTFLLLDHHPDLFHRPMRCSSIFSAHIRAPVRN